MTDPPERWKDRADYTTEEHAQQPQPRRQPHPRPRNSQGLSWKQAADSLLHPDGLSAVPDKVQALSDEAVRLRDAALLAGRQLAVARAEAKQAVALDAAADRAAAAVGRPLPEQRVAAEAAEAVELAQRRSAAASQNARDHRSTGDGGAARQSARGFDLKFA